MNWLTSLHKVFKVTASSSLNEDLLKIKKNI